MSQAYFARDALSSSGIKELQKSPYHFYFRSKEGAPNPNAAHFRIGHAMHTLLTGKGKDIVLYNDTKTFNSKAGEAFLKVHEGKTCLTPDEQEMVVGMTEAMLSYPTLVKMLDGAQSEFEIYVEYEGVQCKASLDLLTPMAILDIKTTADDAADFYWALKNYKYDIQAAWYQLLYEIKFGKTLPFYFLAVEKNAPYGVEIIELEPDTMATARSKCLRALETYRACKQSNLWPRKPLEIRSVGWKEYV